MKEKCKNCIYYLKQKTEEKPSPMGYVSPFNGRNGICRRYPRKQQSVVNEDDWCGEYKAKYIDYNNPLNEPLDVSPKGRNKGTKIVKSI